MVQLLHAPTGRMQAVRVAVDPLPGSTRRQPGNADETILPPERVEVRERCNTNAGGAEN